MVTPAASLMGTPEVSESKPWGIAKIGPGYCLTGYGLGITGGAYVRAWTAVAMLALFR